VKIALADRDANVSDPDTADENRPVGARRDEGFDRRPAPTIDRNAPRPAPRPAGPRRRHALHVCSGLDGCCEPHQSNFSAIGSGRARDRWGINLQKTALPFSLDSQRRERDRARQLRCTRSLHTLSLTADGSSVVVFGTMGGQSKIQNRCPGY